MRVRTKLVLPGAKAALTKERGGFSGLLMLATCAILAFAMIFSVTFMQASTARSVAESVEHTIALECLSSCYINNSDSQTWTSNTVFKALSSEGTPIDPLAEFNQIMTSYHLMGAGGAEQILMRYDKQGSDGISSPTFELQIYGWNSQDTLWGQLIPITPNVSKVVIEDIYLPSV